MYKKEEITYKYNINNKKLFSSAHTKKVCWM